MGYRSAGPSMGRTWWSKVAVIVLIGLTMTACQQPADEGLVTGGTEEEFRASLSALVPKLTPHELEAFQWAVSDFDLPQLHAKYPEGSPRTIIRGEVQDVLDTYPAKIAALEKQAAKDAPLRAELGKIIAREVRFSIEKNFFGLQPVIRAVAINGSRYPVSHLKWRAALYLDGADTPVAQTILVNDYRQQGGFKPGARFQLKLPIGFVRGDETWTTLEIRNATNRRVVLEPVLDSILDFGERAYLAEDPIPRIERMRVAIDAAKRYADI
jgi:hypothetical protein